MPENKGGQRLIPVLYEDNQCVVFDKPPGLLVTPADDRATTTLTDIVNEQYATQLKSSSNSSSADLSFRFHPCHRLDKDTSGVILYAKGKRNQQMFMDVFNQAKVKKFYTAFVHGRLPSDQGEIKSAIRDHYQEKFAKHSSPKMAVTRYRVKEKRKEFSIVDVMPLTGRTNQIRIHFADMKHPLVGEDKYAFRKDFVLKFKRTALHARELQWYHPVLKKTVNAAADLPEDMVRFLSNHQ
jgi:23S rRNA pseudouridine1911/1915/1917 synthase